MSKAKKKEIHRLGAKIRPCKFTQQCNTQNTKLHNNETYSNEEHIVLNCTKEELTLTCNKQANEHPPHAQFKES